ncbi:hypothetical protein VPH35_116263 [Triticum aestivum]|uniref:DUF4220 domain-containing protein n=1 Tax=Aegilops tauschii TaxID=37682 RepID=M8B723_AEGTA
MEDNALSGRVLVFVPLQSIGAILVVLSYRDQVFHNKDVDITCILMGTTLVLDVRWLLRAIGSTWTYAFLKGTKCEELQHAVLCSGRWQRLRRLVVTLDPSRLSCSSGLKEPSSSYRMWARTIGQHNLLREFRDSKRFFSRLATSIGLEESWNEFCYSGVRGLDFSPDEAVRNYLFKTVFLWCGPEDIAVWPRTDKALSTKKKTAIKALSDYMLFLVAVRPGMLPGLKLRSLYEGTRSALNKLWDEEKEHHSRNRNTSGVAEKLAGILRDMEGEDELRNSTLVLSDGAGCAWRMLTLVNTTKLSLPRDPKNMPSPMIKRKLRRMCPELFPDGKPAGMAGGEPFISKEPEGMELDMMLNLILDVWVHLLIYASIRCSRSRLPRQAAQSSR